jgi:predicted NBD/HSP70 family sugar kinase
MREARNHRRVLEALHGGARSRPEVARATGLSRPTVTALVAELVALGVVHEHPAGPAQPERAGPSPPRRGGGRPARRLALSPDAGHALGLDFGREHVRVVLCDLTGRPIADAHEPIPLGAPASVALDRAAALAHAALRDHAIARDRVIGAGAAVAAPIDRSSGALHPEGVLPGWAGVRPAAELAQRLGVPVRLANDANAGALGERAFGAARDVDDLVYVRLSAGVGAGIVVGGALYVGGSGMAGEIGHVAVVPDGPICRCGNRGCLEVVASPVAIAGLLAHALGEPLSVAGLLALVADGHRGALRAVTEGGELVGRAVAATVNVLNPRVVVVGGELAAAGDVLLEAIRGGVARHAAPPVAETVQVRRGALGDRAEVLGAAALALESAPQALARRVAARRAG